ncbi:MAG: cytochrome c [Pseudomonadota bacterium]
MRLAWTVRGAVAAAGLIAGGAALAHSGATGIVKARMDGMKTMSDAAKALGAVKAGAIPYAPLTIRRAAGMLITEGTAARGQFPEGSASDVSEALPAIWSERAGFDRLLEDLIAAAERMEAAADDEAAAMRAAEDVAATCKDCHAKYRAKKL